MKIGCGALWFVILCFMTVQGEELRVPSEYPTIQLALGAVLDGDTILVAPGEYIESLTAPPRDFVLRGEVRIDSQTTEFSIINPTDLAGSDSLRCMTLTGGKASFEDIVFRNRSGMTADRPAGNPGGVKGDTTVSGASFERCIFDSVRGGVTRIDRINIRSCRFIGSPGTAVYTGLWRGKLTADSTWFDGVGGGLVTSGHGCEIRNCLFTHGGDITMFRALGDSVYVENCHFIGTDTLNFEAIIVRPGCGSIMRDCVIENLHVRGQAVVVIADSCYEQQKDLGCTFEFINNRIVRCGSGISAMQQGGEPLYVYCFDNSDQGFLALIDSSRFDSIEYVRGRSSAILLRASAVIRYSFMGDDLQPDKPQIAIYDRSVSDTVYLRLNSFAQEVIGIDRFLVGNAVVDARWNWWGHESGPFHSVNNPQGEGASVDDDILFNPWLTSDPDTTHHDTSEFVSPTPDELFPDDFTLVAYPNPFNAVTTLAIEVARAGEYKVLLYDVTGRVAASVFSGRIEDSQRVSVDAAGMASGVYFAQLRGGDGVLAVGKVLLIR